MYEVLMEKGLRLVWFKNRRAKHRKYYNKSKIPENKIQNKKYQSTKNNSQSEENVGNLLIERPNVTTSEINDSNNYGEVFPLDPNMNYINSCTDMMSTKSIHPLCPGCPCPSTSFYSISHPSWSYFHRSPQDFCYQSNLLLAMKPFLYQDTMT
ncbi:uncharacterized protein LOC111633103 [Centruroides sculpturatus]|uniref:uncharacterized protein LOC111633103 n=1 Tax=Centruroides sculpturatus TaxID=218467 RepID=UPI000C6E9CDC|nr:uncharacterized protein LOC111633103 [Centruroides sculpturatus]